jgi:hypothetical protein
MSNRKLFSDVTELITGLDCSGFYYVLNDQDVPVRATYAEYLEKAEPQRIRKQTDINSCLLSTVFLGIDHSFSPVNDPDHVPIIFETMIFGGEYDGFQRRYTSNLIALDEHDKIAARLQSGLSPEDDEF